MSIATKRGDDGETDLMFGRRVSKSDQRVAAYGAVDELNAIIGLVRVAADLSEMAAEMLPAVQKELVTLMGELATAPEDLERYLESGFEQVSADMVDRLSGEVDQIEQDFEITFKGWAMPGDAGLTGAAHLDQARTVCRRAEREVILLNSANGEIVRYLNRLSDVFWLMARVESNGK